jgi:hypothetical protein
MGTFGELDENTFGTTKNAPPKKKLKRNKLNPSKLFQNSSSPFST